MPTQPTSIDAYLAPLPPWQRSALERLRRTVKAAAPGATEAITYQMPTIKLDGRSLVAFAAFKDHCSLFPMSLAAIAAHEKELSPYHTGKGTISFKEGESLPAALVTAIVKQRVKENAERASKSSRKARRRR